MESDWRVRKSGFTGRLTALRKGFLFFESHVVLPPFLVTRVSWGLLEKLVLEPNAETSHLPILSMGDLSRDPIVHSSCGTRDLYWLVMFETVNVLRVGGVLDMNLGGHHHA